MLQVAIGIIFVMLLFSLLASTILELLAGFLSLRGRQLLSAIRGMIGQAAATDFVNHPYFQQLAAGSREKAKQGKTQKTLPSYINAGSFSAILLDLYELETTQDIQSYLARMPDNPLKKIMVFLYKQSNGELLDYKKRLEEWFNEVMDRASGAYKRNSQRMLFLIGLGLALVFNADTLGIYHNLSINAALRGVVAESAANFVNNNESPAAPNLDNPNMEAARIKIGALVNDNISALETPLGLGWTQVHAADLSNPKWWLYKIIGWITTALAVSLGASFWFEVLKKLVNLRNAGPPPPTVQPTSTTPVVISPGSALTKAPSSIFQSGARSAKPPMMPGPKAKDPNTPG